MPTSMKSNLVIRKFWEVMLWIKGPTYHVLNRVLAFIKKSQDITHQTMQLMIYFKAIHILFGIYERLVGHWQIINIESSLIRCLYHSIRCYSVLLGIFAKIVEFCDLRSCMSVHARSVSAVGKFSIVINVELYSKTRLLYLRASAAGTNPRLLAYLL